MKLSETSEDQLQVKVDYIDKRWAQLHELEIKRGDTVLNYLFMVSGGASAATLAYIGNVAKEGNVLPIGVLWMLGCFATSLLLVGLLKIRLIYHVVAIFKGWRSLVARYYSDELPWSEVLTADERTVRQHAWIIHVIGWVAYLALIAGVVIGFVKLQEETSRVRAEKTASAGNKAAAIPTQPINGSEGFAERGVQRTGKNQSIGRGGAGDPSTSATKEKIASDASPALTNTNTGSSVRYSAP